MTGIPLSLQCAPSKSDCQNRLQMTPGPETATGRLATRATASHVASALTLLPKPPIVCRAMHSIALSPPPPCFFSSIARVSHPPCTFSRIAFFAPPPCVFSCFFSPIVMLPEGAVGPMAAARSLLYNLADCVQASPAVDDEDENAPTDTKQAIPTDTISPNPTLNHAAFRPLPSPPSPPVSNPSPASCISASTFLPPDRTAAFAMGFDLRAGSIGTVACFMTANTVPAHRQCSRSQVRK
mmetsp:Transcript_28899/g.68492  ORF Transcript_28899/g.68492 Transcript_28899/m.68492 type:complete len:239 (+) Transcript_28899:1266-1982(+)